MADLIPKGWLIDTLEARIEFVNGWVVVDLHMHDGSKGNHNVVLRKPLPGKRARRPREGEDDMEVVRDP